MTTFGISSASCDSNDSGYLPENDALKLAPNINVIRPSTSDFRSNSGGSGTPTPMDDSDQESQPGEFVPEEYPLISTQPGSQSQHTAYNPELDQHLVGSLIPSTHRCSQFDLTKDKKSKEWTIGRHPTNDLVLPGLRLSNFHCKLIWNGELGQQSVVRLEDFSTNGTWVNGAYVKQGGMTLLRSGAAISLGAQPDTPNNDWRFIFRDVEGQSTRHAKQIWSKYDISHELGSGAFARVYRCAERATGHEYAVKIINKDRLRRTQPNEESMVREIKILKQLAKFHHKNIVSLHEHFEEDDAIYLVLELVGGGDLLSYIGRYGALPEQQVRRMAAQICHAVAYVHSEGIAHRDLKPENVMMTATDPPECKVADFGLAKLVDEGTFLKTMCGTPAYLAPEVMLRTSTQQAYDNRVDSWSLGVIFYCMLTNHSPFRESFDPNFDAAQQRHYFGTRQVDWEYLRGFHLSDDGHDFLRNLLIEDPRNRKDPSYMLDHPWISNLVPSDSRFFDSHSETISTPTTTDGALACSQSMQCLNLSDISIPGLSMIDQHVTNAPGAMSISAAQPSVESFVSEVSVTSKIPGAFPKSKKDKVRQPLAAVEEAAVEEASWDFLVPPMASGAVNPAGPSRRTPSPSRLPAKRKSDLIAGNSPLSSLSSSDDDNDYFKEMQKKPAVRRAGAPRSKGKAVESPASKRRTRPSSAKPRRANVTQKAEDDTQTRRSARHPKTPRYT